MARTAYGKHSTQVDTATYPDDPSVPIGSDEWNASPSDSGMLGFNAETIASATSITPSNTVLNISGSTDVTTITQGNTNEYDLLYVFTSGTVTLVHNTGNLKLISGSNKDLSTTIPTILIRKGTDWIEYGGGGNVTGTVMSGHIIPDTNDTYDIGSASYKIRDMYVSDNSLWVGDDHKIDISGGKMKFKKRKTSSVPSVITTGGGNEAGAKSHSGKGTLGAIKLNEWVAYARSLGGSLASARPNDIFRTDESDDWLEDEASITSEQASAITANTAKVGLSNTVVTDAHLAGSISLSKLANGTVGKIIGFNASTGVVEEQDAPVTTIGAVSMPHDTTSGNHTFPTGATSSSNDTYNAPYSNASAGSFTHNGSNGSQAYWSSYSKFYDFAVPTTVTGLAGTCRTNYGGNTYSKFRLIVKDVSGNTLTTYSSGNIWKNSGTVSWSHSCNITGATEIGWEAWSQGSSFQGLSNNWTGTATETRNPAVVFDGTTTYWKSLSENNPNVYVDMGSTATAIGVMINRDGTDTSETEFKIETSPDASTWTTKRTVTMSNVSAGSDVFVRIPPTSCRYVRIYGTGTSKSLAIRHFKIKTATNDEITASHSHLDISTNDTSLGLDGT
jgi:hypothetical protein